LLANVRRSLASTIGFFNLQAAALERALDIFAEGLATL